MKLTARERKILKMAQDLLRTQYRPRHAGDYQRGYGVTDGKREAAKRILKLFPKAVQSER